MAKNRFKFKAEKTQAIAQSMIRQLFLQAQSVYHKDPALADRYVEIARAISMKIKVRIPAEFRRRFCGSCSRYLVPGDNCRVRLRGGKIIYYCIKCRSHNRFGYAKEQKSRRKEKQKK
jgi:ribonuclease P protein subunit RPR2